MPGHKVLNDQEFQDTVNSLESLIEQHDLIFLLMDTREGEILKLLNNIKYFDIYHRYVDIKFFDIYLINLFRSLAAYAFINIASQNRNYNGARLR